MKISWAVIKLAMNPFAVCRRYEVEVSGWASGYSRYFWRLREAQEFFDSVKDSAPFVILSDTFFTDPGYHGHTIKNADNSARMPPPPVYRDSNGDRIYKREPGYVYDARPKVP